MKLSTRHNGVAPVLAPAGPVTSGGVKVGRIPADAEFVFGSNEDGEMTDFGFPAVELYVGSRKGEVTRITYSRHAHNHFDVSPDRSKIAANRYREDTNKDGRLFPLDDWKDLWIIDVVNGTERKLVPQLDAGLGGISWMPDSRNVVFATPTPRGRDIVMVDTETEKVTMLTDNLDDLLKNKSKRLVADVGVSPDGQWFVFTYRNRIGEPDEPKGRVAIMRVDGSEARILTDGGPLPKVKRGNWYNMDYDPEFSPDGREVAFARQTDLGMSSPTLSSMDMMTVRIDGTGLTRISPEGNVNTHCIPSWDERGLLFEERTAGKGDRPLIYDPKTKRITPVPLTNHSYHVQWIPQGR